MKVNSLKVCGCFDKAIVHSKWTLEYHKSHSDRFITGMVHFNLANIFHTKVRLELISKNPTP